MGNTYVAIDLVQAGPGDRVLVLTEGNGMRQLLGEDIGPIRSAIVGIIVSTFSAGQNVNYAVKIEYLAKLIEDQEPPVTGATLPRTPGPLEEMVARVQNSVVLLQVKAR